MEVVLFLILFIIFVLMIVALGTLSDIKSRVEKLDTKVSSQLKTLREELALSCKDEESPKKTVVVSEPVTLAVAPLFVAKPVLSPTETPKAEIHSKSPVLQQPPVDSAAGRIMSKIWNWIVVGEEFRNPGVPAEFAIATAWLVRVGVIVVVMAVGFGLQLSIKRGILGPSGRVACSLICGSVFVGLGLRCMTKKLQMLGQGFIGGGLAMFYFSFYAASMMFNLMPAQFAFLSMALVTAMAVVIAVRLNALSVAVLGAIGGYLTPVMLTTEHPNLHFLYVYLLILGVGILGVSLRRQWPLLTWLSFICNSIIFLIAAAKPYGKGTTEEIIYLCVFFVLYSSALFAYAVLKRVKVTPVEIAPLFLNVMVTLGGGVLLIGDGQTDRVYVAILALGMATFYVAHIWGFILGRHYDRGLLSAFVALVVILVGIALPLLFTDHILTTALALQALAFLWLGGRLESRMFIRGAICLYGVVAMRICIGFLDPDSFALHATQGYWNGLRERLAEFVFPMLALFLAGRLFNKLPMAAQSRIGDEGVRETNAYAQEAAIAFCVFYAVFIVDATLETFSMSKVYSPEFGHACITLVWCAFVFHLMAMRKHLSSSVRVGLSLFAGTAIVAQWFFCGWMGVDSLQLFKLCHHEPFSVLTALPRLVSTGVCMMALLKIWDIFKSDEDNGKVLKALALNSVLAMGFLYLTFEAATFSDAYVQGFRQWAVSIVWGCYGLSLLVSGLNFAKKELRMVGLILFAITIFKIFFVDLAASDVLFRLIAFALVGIVLLLAAYAYLRKQDAFKKGE
ncbi:MAG: DUF2339 domain-containing protein [bacterium]